MSPLSEPLVESLTVKLWSLVAAKVETHIAAEMGQVQLELVEMAQRHRESGTEYGRTVADRLEATSGRLARQWLLLSRLRIGCMPAASSAGGITSVGPRSANGSNNAKRSRGRPRRNTPLGLDVPDQQVSSDAAEPPCQEIPS